MNKPRRTKIALAVAAGLIAVPVVTLVVLLNFDWNRAKPWLNARTSEMLGRPFAITGDLSLTWEKPAAAGPAEREEGWRGIIPWPYLVAQDIHIGNPSNMKALMPAEMASIKQFAFSLNPLLLLKKKIAIPDLHFESPVINLLRGSDGKNNWTFKNDDKPSPWQLKLQGIIITKGRVHLIDAIKHADVTANIDTINADPGYGVAWQLHGKVNGETVSGNINLTQEQLDLTINPNSKGLRVLSLRAPLYVRGSFKEPSVSVDKGVLAMKAGGAIALAALAPVALAPAAALLALIPLINTGPGENSECAKLLADARVKPVAPPPGKTYHRKVKLSIIAHPPKL